MSKQREYEEQDTTSTMQRCMVMAVFLILSTGCGGGGSRHDDAGTDPAEALVEALMGSDGDCANVMHLDATQIGVGLAVSTAGDPLYYWTLVHGHE